MTIVDLDSAECETFSNFRDHYAEFWSSEKNSGTISGEEGQGDRDRLRNAIEHANRILSEAGFDTSEITALLFTGSGGANGHAYLQNGACAAWFDVECFGSERSARVFAMHELIHALHYRASPEFWFHSVEEQSLMWRQLITEGIATYATSWLLDISDAEALWADALPDGVRERWMAQCIEREGDLFRHASENFSRSMPNSHFFSTGDSSELFGFRQGYYVGLQLIREIVERNGLSLPELIAYPANELRALARETIQERASPTVR